MLLTKHALHCLVFLVTLNELSEEPLVDIYIRLQKVGLNPFSVLQKEGVAILDCGQC